MRDDTKTHPYQVTVLDNTHDDFTVKFKKFHCRTFMGAWWLLGQYRCADYVVILEQYNTIKGEYDYLKSVGLTEYT